MAVYEKSPDVEISIKDGKEAVFRNTKTNKERTYTKKQIVEVADFLEKNKQNTSTLIANRINIREDEVKSVIKDLLKEGFIIDIAKEDILFS
jgi:predicted HTH transcriptional regulator